MEDYCLVINKKLITEKQHINYIKNKIWSYNIVYQLLTGIVNNNILLRKAFNNNAPNIFSYLTGYDYDVLHQIKLMFNYEINLIKKETAILKTRADAAKEHNCCCFYDAIIAYNKRISKNTSSLFESDVCYCVCCSGLFIDH